MPTDALESILYRDLAKAAAKEAINVASPLLGELVNFSTNALVRCATSSHGQENEDLAVLYLYRHMIEMTDGIDVLISSACPRPAVALVRSSFEAWLSMLYIFEADYTQRSYSWLAHYAHERIATHQRLDPSTARGKEFAKQLRDDPCLRNVTLGHGDAAQKVVANMQKLLSRPEMRAIKQEYERTRKARRGRRPAWYELWNGPRNLRDLAGHLNKLAVYDFLYRYWSRVSHAHDFSQFLSGTGQGDVGLKPLRDPNTVTGDTRDVASFAAWFLLEGTRLLLGRFRPMENIRRWYLTEVRELNHLLSRIV